MSTPQMIYKVKHVSKRQPKDNEGNKGKVTIITKSRFYKRVKFVIFMSLVNWLVSVAGNG